MKTINIQAMNQLDHDDVKDMVGGGERKRRVKRLQIIKQFMRYAAKNPDTFKQMSP